MSGDTIGADQGDNTRNAAIGKGIEQTDNSRKNDGLQASIINYNESSREPRTGHQTHTQSQVLNELVEKVDRLLDLIQGDPEQDIKGIRPRVREIEQRQVYTFVVLGLIAIFQIAIALGWHL